MNALTSKCSSVDDDFVIASEKREALYDLDAEPITVVIIHYARKPDQVDEECDSGV